MTLTDSELIQAAASGQLSDEDCKDLGRQHIAEMVAAGHKISRTLVLGFFALEALSKTYPEELGSGFISAVTGMCDEITQAAEEKRLAVV